MDEQLPRFEEFPIEGKDSLRGPLETILRVKTCGRTLLLPDPFVTLQRKRPSWVHPEDRPFGNRFPLFTCKIIGDLRGM